MSSSLGLCLCFYFQALSFSRSFSLIHLLLTIARKVISDQQRDLTYTIRVWVFVGFLHTELGVL